MYMMIAAAVASTPGVWPPNRVFEREKLYLSDPHCPVREMKLRGVH